MQLLLLVGHQGETKRLLTHPLDAAPGNGACTESSFEMATYTAKTRQKHEAQESGRAEQTRKRSHSQQRVRAPRARAPDANPARSSPHRGLAAPAVPEPHPPRGTARSPSRTGTAARTPCLSPLSPASRRAAGRPPGAEVLPRALPPRGRPGLASPHRAAVPRGSSPVRTPRDEALSVRRGREG